MQASPITSDLRHGPENPVNPVSSVQHKLCCSCMLCCGLKGSWRDGIMFTIEGGTAVSAIVTFALTNNPYIGGGLAILTIGELVVHGLWRRDAEVADLHRVVVDLGHIEDKVETTTKKTDQVAEKIKKENEKLNQERL